YVAVVQDIGDRKRLERDLEESQRRLHLAAKVGKIGVFEWHIPSDINIWSPELEALYGLPAGGFRGTYEGWAQHVHPDDLPAAEARVREALHTGSFHAEWRTIWPDGSVHWIEA